MRLRSLAFLGAALAAGAAVAWGAAAARAQEAIELKLSHFLPPSHGIHRDFIEPWARELEARTDGGVKVTVFPGPGGLGNVARQYDQVVAGVTDIAHGLTGIPRGRFPRTGVIDLPFLTDGAGEATCVLWRLLLEHLADEYEGVKVLALHAHNPGLIHTRGRRIETAGDMRGLRVRTPSPAIGSMLEYLGATPVGLPPDQVYENLQKGALDGTVFPWDAIGAFRLYEVLDHHLDARAYTTSFYFVMNRQRYESLPEDVRAAIDELSGENLTAKFGAWWDEWDQPGLEAAKARGNEIIPLREEEREAWRERLGPMIDGWLDQLEADGVANARDIYAEAQRLAEGACAEAG